jgi:hypothetical protein
MEFSPALSNVSPDLAMIDKKREKVDSQFYTVPIIFNESSFDISLTL